MATQRVLDYLATARPEGPCLVVDLDVVRENYLAFARALPETRIFYAVKANPAPEVLNLLAGLGSSFDTASVTEIEMALAAGATPDRISFGNTIKKERDIARAFQLGIDLYAVDCVEEVEKIARQAPGARVFCRVLADGAGAVGQHAAEHAGAGRLARDLLHLLDAVDRIEVDAELEGARDVAFLLDGVAERDAVGRRAGGQRHLDLRHRGGVEARAQPGQQVQHFRRRIGLHRIEDARFRQRPGERQIVFTNDVEIDDETRAFRPRGGKIVKDALGRHKTDPLPSLLPAGFRTGDAMEAPNPGRFLQTEMEQRQPRRNSGGCLRLEREDRSAHGAKMVCLFSVAGFWTAD